MTFKPIDQASTPGYLPSAGRGGRKRRGDPLSTTEELAQRRRQARAAPVHNFVFQPDETCRANSGCPDLAPVAASCEGTAPPTSPSAMNCLAPEERACGSLPNACPNQLNHRHEGQAFWSCLACGSSRSGATRRGEREHGTSMSRQSIKLRVGI